MAQAPISPTFPSSSSSSSSSSSTSPYALFAANYEKLFKRLESRSLKKQQPMALLVMSGAFNPPHIGHIHALEAAAALCQNELGLEIAGGVLSLSHDTVVRNKLKRWPTEVITPRHRLRLCQEIARRYGWITVDRWEITRRAALEYLSVLEHVRRTWHSVDCTEVKVFLVCDVTDMIKASPMALHSAGFGAITTCRLEEIDKITKTIARQMPPWNDTGFVAENTAMVPHEIVGLLASSSSVRRLLTSSASMTTTRTKPTLKYSKMNYGSLDQVMEVSAIQYLLSEHIGLKMAGREPWTKADHEWCRTEREWMEQTFKIEDDRELYSDQREAEEEDVRLTQRMVKYSRE